MKKSKLISWLLLLGCFTGLLSITTNSSKVQLPFKGKFFTTDNLGNLFLVKQDNSIEKYSPKGKRLMVGNYKIYGGLTQLDVSNPFEIYAYYGDQQTLLILDNMLNLRSEINMSDISTGEVSAAARSFDNGIWYFDASSMKLLKANKKLSTQIQGVPMATWTNEVWKPTQIIDNEKNVLVLDSSNGICIFDVFGNYYKNIEQKGLKDFQVKKNQVIYFKDSLLVRYDFKLFRQDTLYQNSNVKSVRVENSTLYIWKNDTLEIKSPNQN